MESLNCPECHSHEIRRSHRKNKAEGFLKAVGIKVYRCDACYWRGYAREDSKGSLLIMSLSEETVETVWKTCIIIVLALAGIAVLIKII